MSMSAISITRHVPCNSLTRASALWEKQSALVKIKSITAITIMFFFIRLLYRNFPVLTMFARIRRKKNPALCRALINLLMIILKVAYALDVSGIVRGRSRFIKTGACCHDI